ncbi:MAG TPA: AI-2E family transporter, partial [Candidatus Binatia bacterium]
MNTGTRVEQIAGLAFLILLLAGCFVVLRPFLSAILWALVISFSTWPVYAWVERRLGGRKGLAAMVTTLSIAALVVVPLVLIGSSLTDEIAAAIVWIRTVLQEGLP